MSEQELQRKPANDQSSEGPAQMMDEGGGNTRFSSEGQLPPVAAGGAGVAQVSASERGYGAENEARAIADQAITGGSGKLPFADQIAASFGGEHAAILKGIKVHTGAQANNATDALGAQAFTLGSNIVFGEGKDTLHNAAHEAAHVVQQKSGVANKLKVGEPGDAYEQAADAVADRVVAGQSAADLLDSSKDSAGGDKAVQSKQLEEEEPLQAKALEEEEPLQAKEAEEEELQMKEVEEEELQMKELQFLGTPLGEKRPEGSATPQYGEENDQRRYSREQYEKMWEEEQGRKLQPHERETIERGCIGITANNIAGGGNPLSSSEANFDDFDFAHGYMEMKNKELEGMRANPETAKHAPAGGQYVMFAKLFWSNQKDPDGANKAPDENAFKADPKTHRMDMSGYKYQGQPGYVNFDYGFWDDNSSCFWHANHMEYKDPEKRKTNPMKVYQSTRDKFIAGYIDFDRIVFGVAFAKNYDPGKAAIAHAGRGG